VPITSFDRCMAATGNQRGRRAATSRQAVVAYLGCDKRVLRRIVRRRDLIIGGKP